MIKKSLFIILIGLTFMVPQAGSAEQAPDSPRIQRWFRGNTHCHTLNSDGDSSPWEVAEWYKSHGYDFVVITDHNFLTDVERLNAVYREKEDFLVIPGVEVSGTADEKSVHVCALNPSRLVLPEDKETIVESLQSSARLTRAAGAVPIIAHPNWVWSFGADEMKPCGDARLFELFNGHPFINNTGWGEEQSTEEMWDAMLSGGKTIFGVASDDAHVFRKPWDRTEARPNQGWVMVEAEDLSAQAIVEALDQGRFYASTGIELEDYEADETGLSVQVNPDKHSKYRILFIGKEGRVFKEVFGRSGSYSFTGDEMYIRIRIEDTNGRRAWTQPIFLKESGHEI